MNTIQIKRNEINELIENAAMKFRWKAIPTKGKMLSFMQSNERINIWIKKNLKVTIRIQPMETIKKDINLIELKQELKNVNTLILSQEFDDEGH